MLPQCMSIFHHFQTYDVWVYVHLQKEEEDAIRAEGSEPQRAPVKPKLAQARAAPIRPAPSLVPQLAMVNGKPVIMESSLTVQAQAEDLQRTITVEDNPVSPQHELQLKHCSVECQEGCLAQQP